MGTAIKSLKPFKILGGAVLLSFGFLQTSLAQVNASPADIKGVKLGMSLSEGRQILESQGYIVSDLPGMIYSRTYRLGDKQESVETGRAKLTVMAKKKEGNDLIQLSTSGHPEKDGIVVVARALKYPESGTRPIWSDVSAQIMEKFGKAHLKHEHYGDGRSVMPNPYLMYEWNSKGKKRSGLMKAAKWLADDGPQPECSLPERVIPKYLGQNFKFQQVVDLSDAYSDKYVSYFGYVNNYIEHSQNASFAYGPTAFRGARKVKRASEDVLVADGCRTVLFIRGDVDKDTEETKTMMFIMMDHRTIKNELKDFEKWSEQKGKEVNKQRREKIDEIKSKAPKVDL